MTVSNSLLWLELRSGMRVVGVGLDEYGSLLRVHVRQSVGLPRGRKCSITLFKFLLSLHCKSQNRILLVHQMEQKQRGQSYGNKQKPPKQEWRLFIQFALARVSFHHFPLVETQKQAGEWESFSFKKKRRLQVCSDWKLLAWRSWRWVN